MATNDNIEQVNDLTAIDIADINDILEEATDNLAEDTSDQLTNRPLPLLAEAPLLMRNESTIQMTLLNNIRKITNHTMRHEQFFYLVTFNTLHMQDRWFTDRCLYRRPGLIINYWQRKAVKKQRTKNALNAMFENSNNTFSVYDF